MIIKKSRERWLKLFKFATAICSKCGYENPYMDADPNYVCTQCRKREEIWGDAPETIKPTPKKTPTSEEMIRKLKQVIPHAIVVRHDAVAAAIISVRTGNLEQTRKDVIKLLNHELGSADREAEPLDDYVAYYWEADPKFRVRAVFNNMPKEKQDQDDLRIDMLYEE